MLRVSGAGAVAAVTAGALLLCLPSPAEALDGLGSDATDVGEATVSEEALPAEATAGESDATEEDGGQTAQEPGEKPGREPGETPDESPRWAVGIGFGVAYFPDYVGADEGRVLPLPIPYVEYESRYFQADRSGLSGLLPLGDDLRLELGVSGALPVDSSDNDARKGMSDLGWIGEVGPKLTYRAWESEDGADRVSAELPVRAAFAFEWDKAEAIGWTISPALSYRRQTELGGGRLRLTTEAGPLFATDRYNDYFYRVPAHDARPDRRAYNADGGYSGARLAMGFSYRIGEWWVGAFGRYINIQGAVFDDSPLVRTNHYLSAGIGAAWIFASSDDD